MNEDTATLITTDQEEDGKKLVVRSLYKYRVEGEDVYMFETKIYSGDILDSISSSLSTRQKTRYDYGTLFLKTKDEIRQLKIVNILLVTMVAVAFIVAAITTL